MKHCPHCQAVNPADHRFCGACGKPLAVTTCPGCGFINPLDFRFCGQCATSLTGAAPCCPSHTPSAERRPLTVLFCDLVNSTGIAERLDPEDLSRLLLAYRASCAQVVTRLGGHIAQYVGDGIMVFFGYPQAHENDAERAVRAGLELVEAMEPLNATPWPMPLLLEVRVGIASGPVVAGELISEGSAETPAVMGHTLNLAARLQSLAAPSTVIIAPSTRRLVGGIFQYRDLGLQDIRGLTEPIQVWQVSGERATDSRFEAAHSGALAPLVGRTAELEELLSHWQRTRAGEGCRVLLSGEAGIGKSRIVQTLRERILSEGHQTLNLQCFPHYNNSPLLPLIQRLMRLAGFAPEDGPDSRLDKLRALLEPAVPDPQRAVALLAELLGIPTPQSLHLNPQRRKEQTLAVLMDWVHGQSRDRPLLLVFEDIHWIDPSSAEFLTQLAGDLYRHPILLLVTCRDDHTPADLDRSWPRLALDRLDRQQSTALVAGLCGDRPLPEQIIEQIIARADGIPLYIEELSKTLLESVDWQDQGKPLPTLSVPETLQESLLARLDQLSSVKTVAQVGAAIGREFSYKLLAAVALMPAAELRDALERLVAAELLISREAEHYRFKHALLQEATYESLLRSQRPPLHARISQVLRDRFPELSEHHPELLAHHLTLAGQLAAAAEAWQESGLQACARSAYREAVSHFNRGIQVLQQLSPDRDRLYRELGLQINLGTALISACGPGAPEVREVFSRAMELSTALPPSPLHFAAYWNWWRISENFQVFRERADRLQALAETLDEPELRLQAHHCQWAVLFNLGDQRACMDHIQQGLALYREDDDPRHAALYGGHDPAVCAHGEAALSLWLQGYPDQAMERIAQALALARRLTHAGSLAHAMDIELMLHLYRRDADGVARSAAALGAFAREQDLPDYQAKCRVFQGWALAHCREAAEGIRLIREGIEGQRAIGTKEDFPIFFDMLAEACGLAGQPHQGLEELEAAFTEAESSGMRHWAAELHRRQGRLLLELDETLDAEDFFCRALSIAQQQQALSLALRAALDLVNLWVAGGRRLDGRNLLVRLYGAFLEGFDTPDLKQAKQLLALLDR